MSSKPIVIHAGDSPAQRQFVVPVRRGLCVSSLPSVSARHRELLLSLGANEVETAATLDETLDTLGNSSRPVDVVVCWLGLGDRWLFRLMEILRAHEAGIAVHMCTQSSPHGLARRLYPELGLLHGVAGTSTYGSSPEDEATSLRTMVNEGWTVRRILKDRIAPTSMNESDSIAIYGAEPGQPIGERHELRKKLRSLAAQLRKP